MPEPKMPQPISDWMNAQMWGTHHLVWHLARRWDLTDQAAHNYVTSNGGSRAIRQEGVTGNGMDFLAMHRVMIRQLIHQFPANAALFGGWPQPPTDPDDVNEPMPANPGPRPFNEAMAAAVNRVHTNIGSFASDDELGLYLETRIRPIAGVPDHLSPDVTTGILTIGDGEGSSLKARTSETPTIFANERVESLTDELIGQAQRTGAAVTFIEDAELLASTGGIGAFLRYQR